MSHGYFGLHLIEGARVTRCVNDGMSRTCRVVDGAGRERPGCHRDYFREPAPCDCPLWAQAQVLEERVELNVPEWARPFFFIDAEDVCATGEAEEGRA